MAPLNLNPLDFLMQQQGSPLGAGQPVQDPLQAQIQQLLSSLGQTQQMPAPVQPAPLGLPETILGGLGNALQVRAQGLGAPIQPQDALEQIRQRRQQRADMTNQQNQQQYRADTDAKRTQAGATLEYLQGERQNKQRAKETEQDREFRRAQGEADRAARSQESAAEIAAREKIAARSAEVDRHIAAIRSGDTRAEIALRKKIVDLEGGHDQVRERQIASEQRDSASNVRQRLPELKTYAKSLTYEGQPISTAGVRELFSDMMVAWGVDDPKLAAELKAKFSELVEPELSKHEQAEQAKTAQMEAEEREKAKRAEIKSRVMGEIQQNRPAMGRF